MTTNDISCLNLDVRSSWQGHTSRSMVTDVLVSAFFEFFLLLLNQFISLVSSMFKTHPHVEDFFMPFTGLARTDEQYTTTLRQHALRVMATVEKCIHRLEEPDRMRHILEQLGSRHAAYRVKLWVLIPWLVSYLCDSSQTIDLLVLVLNYFIKETKGKSFNQTMIVYTGIQVDCGLQAVERLWR